MNAFSENLGLIGRTFTLPSLKLPHFDVPKLPDLSSIPLAFISAEGIAYDVSERSIFNMDKNRPAIAGWLAKQEVSELASAFLASLAEQHPMSKPRKGKLSRHWVLHGRDTDYGSELFSLQAIALLGFVGWAFAEDGLLTKKQKGDEQA